MNYGYDRPPHGWKGKRGALVARLEDIITSSPPDSRGRRARVESGDDTLYGGVRVRSLTHYGDEDLDRMIELFDQAYAEVIDGAPPRPLNAMPDGSVRANLP